MGLSWHGDAYAVMVDELREYFSDETNLTSGEIEEVLGDIINIMIDNGAVDPT